MNEKFVAKDVTGKLIYIGSKVVCLHAGEGRLVDATITKLTPKHAIVTRVTKDATIEFVCEYHNMVVNGYGPT